MKKGKVYIVGAGPGDISLLTIKGLRCLMKAEVVVYDFHINAQMLNYISHDAEFIYAGKRGGSHHMTQDQINETLLKKAKEGKIICRLKGGDPFVFGRGGEEAAVLANENIEFEVVPGVTSSIAAPAYAGIPLTHRGYSSSVAVVPGNEDPTKKETSINWAGLANGVGTIVFLMAINNLAQICEKLIENGRDPETPVAVVRWGTRADQTSITGKLNTISDLVKENDIKPPAVTIVGDVVKLRDSLKWYENKPLFGERVLITREHTSGFGHLEELGAEVIEFHTIKTVPPDDWSELDRAIDQVESYNWIVFTSANGVRFFFKRLFERDRDIRDLKGIKFCSIGTKTAEVIKGYGINVDLIPKDFNAEGLVDSFRSDSGAENLKILMPRAETARDLFPDKIRELGAQIDVVTVYRAVKTESYGRRLKRFLKEGKVSIATFTSAATFTNFMDIMKDDAHDLLKDVNIAAIGPVTAKAIEAAGLKVTIMPEVATIDAMVKSIIEWAAKRQ